MSVQAISWAMRQVTGRSAVRFALVAVANYADDEGKCWPSQKMLAADTEQSVDSIQRHLKDLERLGLLYRTPRRRDTGTRASDYLILLMHDAARAFAAVHGWSALKPGEIAAPDNDPAQENDLSDPDEEPTKAADCGLADAADQGRNWTEPRPQLCGSNEPSLNHQNSPLPPKGGGVDGQVDSEGEPGTKISSPRRSAPALRDWALDWSEFERLWPWRPEEARFPCQRPLARMLPEDRRKLLDAIPRYLAHVRAGGLKRVDAKRFVRERIFESFETKGKPGGVPRIPVVVGTPAWEQWQAAYRAQGKPGSPVTDIVLSDARRARGWYFPSLYPPSARDGPPAATAGLQQAR